MMIVYTCPKCGHDLFETVLTSNPPIHRKECLKCGWSWQSTPEPIRRIPFQPPVEDPELITLLNVQPEPFTSPACQNCGCNPANGGTGICNCTLGQNIIY